MAIRQLFNNTDTRSDALFGVLLKTDGRTVETAIDLGLPEITSQAKTITANITQTGTTTITGQLNVDNLRLDANTLSSTNTNGDISLDPNGTGNVDVVSGSLEMAGTAVITTGAALTNITAITVDNLNLNGNTLSSTSGNVIIAPVAASNVEVTLASGDALTINSSKQPITLSGTFSVAAATINADDGTGVKGFSFDLPFAAIITRAWIETVQADGSNDNTLDLIINDTDDGVSAVTTLASAKSIQAAGLQLKYDGVAEGANAMARTSATNRYLVAVVKDVANDGDATQAWTGTYIIEYVKV